MNITDDIAVEAVRSLFVANAPRGRGPLDERALYRLWETTGLRRDDLARAIIVLTESQQMTSELRDGNCYLSLSRGGAKSAGGAAAAKARAEVLVQAATRAHTLIEPLLQRRRRQDRGIAPAAGGDQRNRHHGRLLAVLPEADRQRLLRQMELVPLDAGAVLWERGDQIRNTYFPVDCILSGVIDTEDGFSSEMAVIGNEGMVGLSVCMGVEQAACRTVVKRAGFAHRIATVKLQEEFHRGGAVQALLLRYSQALLVQVAHSAVCNRRHTIGPQVCRMLLSTADRTRSNTLAMTHETVAATLGVRREGVTQTLGRLSRMGVIKCERGHVTLLNRKALETMSCECYGIIRAEFDAMRALAPKRSTVSGAPFIVPRPVTATKAGKPSLRPLSVSVVRQ